MKLPIKYKSTITSSDRDDEKYGSWYCNKDFRLLSVHRKQPSTSWTNEVEVNNLGSGQRPRDGIR